MQINFVLDHINRKNQSKKNPNAWIMNVIGEQDGIKREYKIFVPDNKQVPEEGDTITASIPANDMSNLLLILE